MDVSLINLSMCIARDLVFLCSVFFTVTTEKRIIMRYFASFFKKDVFLAIPWWSSG